MLHQTKWIGLSLALHLAVALGLTVVPTRVAERTPPTIMVTLDSLESPNLPRLAPRQARVRSIARPAIRHSPATSKMETTKSEPIAHAFQPFMPTGTLPGQPTEQNQATTLPKVSAEPAASLSSRHAPLNAAPQPALTSEPEKAQQHYLKEHFNYIRNLITLRLVYPAMARKMGWSGKVIVSFVIAEDGTVDNIRVVESSGFPLLDKSAVATVRMAAPFPKPPVRAEIVVPINFQMLQ